MVKELKKLRRKFTLVIIYDNEKILLGMKKKGFGEGKWNGFGGKVKRGENILESAERELFEESCLKIKSRKSLVKRGIINFRFENNLKEILEINFFSIANDNIVGEPKETKEMLPKWFDHNKIPYQKMWVDDAHWLPLLLAGKNFSGEFYFNYDGSKILKKKLNTTDGDK